MIIGHIGAGLLVQSLALRVNGPNTKLSLSIPAWCTVMGATLSDVITGTLIILGIEKIRSNASITPIGLSLVNIDWSHSFLMIAASAAAWATFCSVRAKCKQHVWGWSFGSVLTHLLCDWLVHDHDMALYPNPSDGTKYGLGLWADVPRSAWFGELGLILLGAGVASRFYGTRKLRAPTALMVGWHLMNFPGVFTNLSFAFSQIFRYNSRLLHYSIGVVFISSYIIPGLFVSRVLDRDHGTLDSSKTH